VDQTAFDNIVSGFAKDVFAHEFDLAASRFEQSGNALHGGTLASTVGAEQGDYLTGLDFQADPAQSMNMAVMSVQVC
jgi:hypothetical protein